MSPGRPAAVDLAWVRFYVDEQLAGLGLGLMALRSDVVVASHPPIADFPRDDPDWIPEVAAHGWVVITNDKHIRTRPGEAEVALQTGLHCVHLAPPVRAAVRWDFARLLLRHEHCGIGGTGVCMGDLSEGSMVAALRGRA